MIDYLHKMWLDLGQPSWVSAANFSIILIYLANKLLDALSKGKRDQEIQDQLDLISYRISKLEDFIKPY